MNISQTIKKALSRYLKKEHYKDKWKRLENKESIYKTEDEFVREFFDFTYKFYIFTLEKWHESYKAAKTDREKRYSFINIHSFIVFSIEIYSAYFLALMHAKENQMSLLFTLANYYSSEINLEHWLKRYSESEFVNKLGLKENYEKTLPNFKGAEQEIKNVYSALQTISKIQKERTPFYNKIKHSGIVFEAINNTGGKMNLSVINKNIEYDIIDCNDNEEESIYKQSKITWQQIRELLIMYIMAFRKYSNEQIRDLIDLNEKP